MLNARLLVVVCGFVLSVSANARPKDTIPLDPKYANAGDAALMDAVYTQKGVNFITAKGLVVAAVLDDDTKGNPHQKFNVKLSNGRIVTIVSNLDMCEKVPVQAGDVVSVGGQFIPTGKASGIVHWVHSDPRKKRPDGFIEFNGRIFCQ